MIAALRSRALRASRAAGLRFGWPRAVAVAWRLATTPVPVPGLRPGPRAGRLVVLPKVGGTEDVVAALEGWDRTDLEVVGLPRAEVKHVWRAVMGPWADGLGDTRYLTDDPAVEAAKLRYRSFLRRVLRHYLPSVRGLGIVSANYAYYAEREVAAAAEELGTPFLVLHKESIRTPAQRPWFMRAYRERIGPFGGRSLAVYNEDERRSMVGAGVAAPDRIHVVGSPRIDVLHRLRERRAAPTADDHADAAASNAAGAGPTVLFAVDPAAGTWTPYDGEEPTGAPRWDELAREVEAALVAAAAADTDRPYVIKVKLGREAATLTRLPAPLPPNLTVVTGGTATELLGRAQVAVAFNTTVVAEAVAAGVPVLVPAFAEAATARAWTFPVDGAVTVLAAPEDLGPALRAARAAGPRAALSEAERAVLVELVGDAEGRAGSLVRRWLAEELGLRAAD